MLLATDSETERARKSVEEKGRMPLSVTQNHCPSGIPQFRRAFPVDPDSIRDGSRKGQKVADCYLCGHPNVPVINKVLRWEYTGHVESRKVGGLTESGRSYSTKREQNW